MKVRLSALKVYFCSGIEVQAYNHEFKARWAAKQDALYSKGKFVWEQSSDMQDLTYLERKDIFYKSLNKIM